MEIEHIDAGALESVKEELNIDVEPTPGTLRLIQVTFPDMRIHRAFVKMLHCSSKLVFMKQTSCASDGCGSHVLLLHMAALSAMFNEDKHVVGWYVPSGEAGQALMKQHFYSAGVPVADFYGIETTAAVQSCRSCMQAHENDMCELHCGVPGQAPAEAALPQRWRPRGRLLWH